VKPIALACAVAALCLAQTSRAQGPDGPLTGARLLQITLPAKDLDRSVAFYTQTLGVKLLFRVKGAAFLDAGGVRLRLEESQTLAPTGSVELYWDDPGLTRLAPLAARGVKFIGPPETVQRLKASDVKLAEFTDPDGNALALMGEVPRAGS
jgi:catechol 2,3-dioxygenase-like lactoylglutathione lyase family enzyme